MFGKRGTSNLDDYIACIENGNAWEVKTYTNAMVMTHSERGYGVIAEFKGGELLVNGSFNNEIEFTKSEYRVLEHKIHSLVLEKAFTFITAHAKSNYSIMK